MPAGAASPNVVENVDLKTKFSKPAASCSACAPLTPRLPSTFPGRKKGFVEVATPTQHENPTPVMSALNPVHPKPSPQVGYGCQSMIGYQTLDALNPILLSSLGSTIKPIIWSRQRRRHRKTKTGKEESSACSFAVSSFTNVRCSRHQKLARRSGFRGDRVYDWNLRLVYLKSDGPTCWLLLQNIRVKRHIGS